MQLAGLIWEGVQIQRFAMLESLSLSCNTNPEKAAESDTTRLGLTRIERATVCEDDAELHSPLRLRIGQYRMWPEGPARFVSKAGLDILWDMTSTDRFVQRHQLAGSGLDVELQALRQHPLVCQYRSAVEHLLRARGACPLLPEVISIAELACLVEPSENEIHIGELVSLHQAMPASGLLRAFELRRTPCVGLANLEGELAANTQHLKVLILAQQEASKTEIAQDLLPDSVPLLIQVGRQNTRLRSTLQDVSLSRRIESPGRRQNLDRAEKHIIAAAVNMRNDRSGRSRSDAGYRASPYPGRLALRLAVQLFDDGRLADASRVQTRCPSRAWFPSVSATFEEDQPRPIDRILA